MRKFSLILSVIILFAAFAVQAQVKTQKPIIIQPPPQYNNLVSVEDDTMGNYLVFSPITGEYRFFRCSDSLEMKGLGKIRIDGCSIILEDVQKDHMVLASINNCTQEAKASIEQFVLLGSAYDIPMKEYLSDKNMRDNKMDCLTTKK